MRLIGAGKKWQDSCMNLAQKYRFGLFAQFCSVLLLWCAFSPLVAMPLYERILFFPDKSDPAVIFKSFGGDLTGACQSVKTVRFSNHGADLSGYFFRLNDAAPVALVSHGNGGNLGHRARLASALLKSGYSVFLYDYQGYGLSSGTASIKGVVSDAVAAYDYLIGEEHIPTSHIVGYGESLGTGVTAELSRQRPLRGIVLQSGFPSLTWAAHDRLWFTWLYPTSWFDDLDCLKAVSGEHAPLMIIHGTKDQAFATRYAHLLYGKASGDKTLCIIKDMTHNLDDSANSEFLAALRRFAREL